MTLTAAIIALCQNTQNKRSSIEYYLREQLNVIKRSSARTMMFTEDEKLMNVKETRWLRLDEGG